MRIKHVLLSVGLSLTVIQHAPPATATPQNEPSTFQRSLHSTPQMPSRDLPQSAFDSQGFDSGLWRSAYLTSTAAENQTADANPVASSTETNSAPPQSESAGHNREKPSDSILYSDNLAMVPIEIPVIMGQSELQATGEPDAHEATALSDWEYTVVKSGGGKTAGATASGPSATSAIVGFVGIIIVIGAYASSGKSTS